jgi:amino acid adenylation domain-containing protein
MLLQHGVTAQARRRPDAIALVFNDTRMTYRALEETSNQLAQFLRAAGCEHGDRVGFLMPKQPIAVVAMLGALKAGAAYVALDPGGPQARLARVLEVSHCRFILTAGQVAPLLADTLALAALQRRPTIGWLDAAPCAGIDPPDFDLQDLAAYSITEPLVPAPESDAASNADVALLLFTSGSTGMPKGVMVTHQSIVAFLQWAMQYFEIDATDRVSQHPPLQFDISTLDIYATLWAGGQVHLVPSELNLLPHRLAQFIRDGELTQWFSVPSMLNLMANFDVVRQGDFPALRRVLFAGEVLPTPALIYWMRRLPHVEFTNLYGPTETTISSSYYTLPRCPVNEQEPIPIGTACDNEELLILDEKLQPVVTGESGELYIGGVGVSPGYWRDPERTRGAFIADPRSTDPQQRIYKTGDLVRRDENGLVYFLGRADMQIKSRGYRIELGEIEVALHALPDLREGAVVAIASEGFEGWQICCAYVPAPDRSVAPESLRKALATRLPTYMLPARWMRYEALPKNPNGKIDRPGLKAAFARAAPCPVKTEAAVPESMDSNPYLSPVVRSTQKGNGP